MALYRFSVKHRGRLTATAPAAQHVAYIMRDADYAPAQAYVAYITRESERAQSREDLVHKAWQNLPAWAEGNPAVFFAAADAYERGNGRLCTTWEITLPRELSRDQQLETMRDFLHTQFGDRQVYAWAMHESHASDGATNPHVHVMFSPRTLDGLERSPEQFFRRYNREHPEQGGAQKDPFLHERRAVAAARQAWADVANWHLERAGVNARLDPRSLVERGIDRDPEARLAPYHSTQAKYEGTRTPAWEQTLQAREARAAEHAQEQAQAAAYWHERTTVLGITPDMSREAFLHQVAEHTRAYQPAREPQSLDALRTQEHALERSIQDTALYTNRLHAAVMMVSYRQEQGIEPSGKEAMRLEALLHQGIDGGLDLLEEDAPHHGAHVHVADKERGIDVGF